MKSCSFGCEASSMFNTGAVMAVPFLVPVNLIGIQVDCAMMFTQAIAPADWAEVLYIGAHITHEQWPNWQTPGDVHQYLSTGGNSDIGTAGFAGAGVGGSAGGFGYLFSIILKTNAPGRGLYIPLNGITLAANDGIFFHMDQMGTLACDVEMQGVVFYENCPAV